MTITAVIAEYNPFHNGHAYQLAKARELTGADYLVVIMSGDFVQRGAPAILDQHRHTDHEGAENLSIYLLHDQQYALN